jgi:hypothetical protein
LPQDQSVELSEETLRALVEIANDARPAQVLFAGGTRGQISALLKMLGSIVEAARSREPERLDGVLRNVASTVSRSPAGNLLS